MRGVREEHRKLECSVGSEGAVGQTRAAIFTLNPVNDA